MRTAPPEADEAVLVTGANGFLGTALCHHLEGKVLALVRAGDAEEAARRLSRAWWRHPDLLRRIGGDIIPIPGDVTRPGLAIPEAMMAAVRRCAHVIHAAASIRFDATREELYHVNLEGTKNVLQLASDLPSLRRLLHVSTAFCTHARPANHYEESKAAAEKEVEAWSGPWTIVRPSMVVGDATTGEVRNFNTIYLPLRLYLTGRLRTLPVKRELRLDIVPVDHVARTCVRLLRDENARRKAYFAVAGSASPTVGEMLEAVMPWAKERAIALRPPRFLPLSEERLRKALSKQGGLRHLAPYFIARSDFPDPEKELRPPPWKEYFPRLLDFAHHHGFMDLDERTVHEHILWRMRSTQLPVDYWDLGKDRRHYSGKEVRALVLRAASGLEGMGVGRGDRVAIIGSNSVRYMVVEMALGLLGAVSVPLYRTAPPREQRELLRMATCKLAFLEEGLRSGAQELGVPCVSLGSGTDGAMAWEVFIAQGGEEERSAPVGMNDPATIRFTSGTTGQPKGAVLSHACLRYCGEEMSAIPPWGTRTAPIRYLSFLPMNHIVEGVIVANAPFYAPAPVTIYYLDDFWKAREALLEARPTVFFAVPRFYEKVWEALCASRLGRRAAADAARGRRTWLTRLAGKKLGRAAGLAQCGHIIVGAAPCPDGLLDGFRILGMEINDAYGLTEAPLVSMNRPRRNVIGSVGELLPGAQAKVEDGEILLRGPQVMTSYLDGGGLRDGWLPTGDLGTVQEGRVFIEGRRKEVIITSYGKNVHPGRAEAALRGIQEVREAMLVGDGRPYCAAIVWTEGRPDQQLKDNVCRSLREINATVSHHEGVRRALLLPYDLSVERGDLTPSLKLRRQVVTERLRAEIEAMYRDDTSCCIIADPTP
jgi:long-chain acyl-CoA synthetase